MIGGQRHDRKGASWQALAVAVPANHILRCIDCRLDMAELRRALGSGLVNPEQDGAGEADGGHERVGASIVAHGDAAPVLEAAKHVLDAMTLPVEHLVVRERQLGAAG